MREYKLHKLRLMILARLLYGKKIELVIDGMLMMVLCDREGRVYDVWITLGRMQGLPL